MVYKSLSETSFATPTVVTVGNFDGVHLGHRLLLQQVTEIARKSAYPSVVVTFADNPRRLFDADMPNRWNLTTAEEKIDLLTQTGIDHVLMLSFDHAIADMSAADFVRRILSERLCARHLVLGADHSFGKNRGGNAENIQTIVERFDIQIHTIDLENCEGIVGLHSDGSFVDKISSSAIRESLFHGDLETANKMLGTDYGFSGVVVAGDKIGRSIAFPTANLDVPACKLLPADGVYGVRISIGERAGEGMLYIGSRPVLKNSQSEPRVEVNIFDFDDDIYGQTLRLTPVFRVRDDIRFSDLNELKAQLCLDREFVRQRL